MKTTSIDYKQRELKLIRAVKGKKRKDRLRNTEIRMDLNIEGIKERLEEMRIR